MQLWCTPINCCTILTLHRKILNYRIYRLSSRDAPRDWQNSDMQGLFTGLLCGLGTQMLTLSIVTLRTDWDKQVYTQTSLIWPVKHYFGISCAPGINTNIDCTRHTIIDCSTLVTHSKYTCQSFLRTQGSHLKRSGCIIVVAYFEGKNSCSSNWSLVLKTSDCQFWVVSIGLCWYWEILNLMSVYMNMASSSFLVMKTSIRDTL